MNAKSFLGALLILSGAFVALLAATYSFMLALPDWTHGDMLSVAMTVFFGGIAVLFGLKLFQRGRKLYAAGDGAPEGEAPVSKEAGYQRKKSVAYFIIVIAVTIFLFMRGHFSRQVLIFAGIAIAISGIKMLLTFVETSPGVPKDGIIEAQKTTKDIMKDL